MADQTPLFVMVGLLAVTTALFIQQGWMDNFLPIYAKTADDVVIGKVTKLLNEPGGFLTAPRFTMTVDDYYVTEVSRETFMKIEIGSTVQLNRDYYSLIIKYSSPGVVSEYGPGYWSVNKVTVIGT
jgi:hypothetical protein